MAHISYLTWLVTVLTIFKLSSLCQDATNNTLTLKSNCICPGYNLTFAECTVDGGPGDSTVWKGSAFDCSSNDIPLVHSRFASSPKAAGECNNGSIEAHGLRVQDNCYTSQLNISVTPNLIGKTIKCVHDNLTAEIVVGTLRVTTVDPLPPPNTLFISKADFISRQITFRWSQAVIECTDLDVRYNILASNCGSCPTTTNHTSVTCTDVPTNGSMTLCMFAVQTVVCGYITGNESETIYVSFSPFPESTILMPTYDSLIVLIVGIVLLVINVAFVVCLLIVSRLRKKFGLTSHKRCNSNQLMEDVYCPPNATIKIFDNEKMGTYGIDDSTDNENTKNTPNNMMGHPPDLNSLLHLLQGKVTSKWRQFGLALGVPKKILDQLTDYSEEDSLVEVLDYWLTHHPNQPTWQEVSDAQDKINCCKETETLN